MDPDEQYKSLKRKFKREKIKYDELASEIVKLHRKQPNLYELEDQISKISHKFKVNDVVVLNGDPLNVAQIEQLIGRKKYKCFVSCTSFKGAVGTNETIHEDRILCHAMDLDLKKVHYKTHGYRRVNEK